MVLQAANLETTARTMLAAAVDVFKHWRLQDDESRMLLGNPSNSTLDGWLQDAATIPPDALDRLAHILAIDGSLRLLFTEPARGYLWLRMPNAVFSGMSALSVMLGGTEADLARVRDYLRAECMV